MRGFDGGHEIHPLLEKKLIADGSRNRLESCFRRVKLDSFAGKREKRLQEQIGIDGVGPGSPRQGYSGVFE
jgi:hypothetical protein